MRIILLCIGIALCLMFIPSNVIGERTPLPDDFVSTIQTNFNVNDTNITFNGINDQTVFYIQFFYLIDGYVKYQYSNHIFDSDTGCYNTDTTTHLDSLNYTHFWFQYFYLIQSMNMNIVRLGAFDDVAMHKCMNAYYHHKDAWDYIMEPMLDMAEMNGVYIDFCFGGGSETYNSNDSGYDDYLTYVDDVMTEYENEYAIAIWDLSNEAYTLASKASYWDSNGGYSAYLSWRNNISTYAQTKAGEHLVTSDGFSNPAKGYGQDGWNDSFDADVFDICDRHEYFSAEDEYLIVNQADWRNDTDTPLLFGECASNDIGEGYVSPYWWYWPWLHNISSNNSISTIWMTLWNYQGYPVSSTIIDEIPSIPYETYEPEPLPEPEIPNPYALHDAMSSLSSMVLVIGIACCVIAYIARDMLGYKGLK